MSDLGSNLEAFAEVWHEYERRKKPIAQMLSDDMSKDQKHILVEELGNEEDVKQMMHHEIDSGRE